MDLLTLVRRLRRDYLDDLGGDRPDQDEWITDDSWCRWSNVQLTDFVNTSVAVYLHTVEQLTSGTADGAISIPLVADQSVYAIPPHVVQIERLRLASWPDDGRVLEHIPHRGIDDDRLSAAGSGIAYYQTDLHNRELRLWGTPTADDIPDTLVGAVQRLAMADLFWDEENSSAQTPETVAPTDRHRLLPYAAYLAYSVEDAEADVEWPQKASRWLQVHLAEVGRLDSSQLHHWRQRNTANRVTRAKPYGI